MCRDIRQLCLDTLHIRTSTTRSKEGTTRSEEGWSLCAYSRRKSCFGRRGATNLEDLQTEVMIEVVVHDESLESADERHGMGGYI